VLLYTSAVLILALGTFVIFTFDHITVYDKGKRHTMAYKDGTGLLADIRLDYKPVEWAR
jgi:hypothetical protein